jgi:DNA-binding ferritin-like protein
MNGKKTIAPALDVIAERIRALGHPAPGTYKEFARLASIKEVEGVPKAKDMIRHLVAAGAATGNGCRPGYGKCRHRTRGDDLENAGAGPHTRPMAVDVATARS